MTDPLTIAGRPFRSRLMLGTGKYDDFATMRAAVDASACELVTIAVRRLDLDAPRDDITSALPDDVLLLPNTSGRRPPPRRCGWRGSPGPVACPTGSSWR